MFNFTSVAMLRLWMVGFCWLGLAGGVWGQNHTYGLSGFLNKKQDPRVSLDPYRNAYEGYRFDSVVNSDGVKIITRVLAGNCQVSELIEYNGQSRTAFRIRRNAQGLPILNSFVMGLQNGNGTIMDFDSCVYDTQQRLIESHHGKYGTYLYTDFDRFYYNPQSGEIDSIANYEYNNDNSTYYWKSSITSPHSPNRLLLDIESFNGFQPFVFRVIREMGKITQSASISIRSGFQYDPSGRVVQISDTSRGANYYTNQLCSYNNQGRLEKVEVYQFNFGSPTGVLTYRILFTYSGNRLLVREEKVRSLSDTTLRPFRTAYYTRCP